MDPIEEFNVQKAKNIQEQGDDSSLRELSLQWMIQSSRHSYSYNFTWLGRPIIQLPQDILALQELIWDVKPDLIIETGIAHGGSLIFHASILELIGGDGKVLGVDIDIRHHNRAEIEKHPMVKRITMIEGSSISPEVTEQVFAFAKNRQVVMVILDSNHTYDHVLRELQIYSPLVTKNSYLIVFDTTLEDVPADFQTNRPWGKGNNPKIAVWDFLNTSDRFIIDKEMENKLLITVARDGYLKCIKD
jgi:cephalosporin hydroxylase